MGRPEKEIDLAQVESLAGRGLNEGQVADALGICRDTLIRRKKKYSSFSEALKRGQAKGVAKIANALFEQGMNGQTAAAIFYMKNRAGWADKQQYSGPGDGPMKIESSVITGEMDPEQATRIYRDILGED